MITKARKINFFHTNVSPSVYPLVKETLESTFLSEGHRVKQFESELSRRLGLLNPVALNSGTSSLHLALALAGVGPGDEVILPPQTFVATGLVILMQAATPVFADIDPMTGNIDPASISEKITERTKAIIPVHWGGYPCDMDEINNLAEQHGISVIEDAAHALGASYRGRPIGSISRFTCFSFQAIKHLTTGDGGALCCRSDMDMQAALVRRWFGIDRVNAKPSILGEREYDIQALGYKYHMNDLAASVGLGNLEEFPSRLARRSEIAGLYRKSFRSVSGVKLLKDDDDRKSANWFFSLRLDRRVDFLKKLSSFGIPASVVHLRIDRNSVFGGINQELEGQEIFNRQQVAIPSHEGISDTDVGRIVKCIREGW